ncbi:hypothetical protein DPMN_006410 [Dreissena polymorpha]|uniref:Uncharacterized protein n=1 Tax=Dreissena polymorpha TaxID=45954 RepID=A0A9D4MSC9_DREPO|nr:hypothetical protein DPMN_006410 [Dreissena polymorpha]
MGGGGISGITTKLITLLKYCLAAPEFAKISEEIDTMIGKTATSSNKHHQLKTSDETRQENNVEKLKKELNDYNSFKDKGDDLFNIVSKKCLSNEAKENIIDVCQLMIV